MWQKSQSSFRTDYPGRCFWTWFSVWPIFNMFHLPCPTNGYSPSKIPTFQPGHFIVIIHLIIISNELYIPPPPKLLKIFFPLSSYFYPIFFAFRRSDAIYSNRPQTYCRGNRGGRKRSVFGRRCRQTSKKYIITL